jgi:KDEL-tailed cysteine endopeptidase
MNTCDLSAHTVSAVSGLSATPYTAVEVNSATAHRNALQTGPIAITIDASSNEFNYYSTGIFNSAYCGTTLDHAIAAVGYGTSGTTKYFIVRNSWGSWWGDGGYILMESQEGTNEPGMCGMFQHSLYAAFD